MSEQDTPMMKQHKDIKSKYPDAYLFFRCGDFYELFGTDAQSASKILDITLTKRGEVPMCGVPYHAVRFYIAKMIKAGKKIAICEQMEDPRLVKGLIKREVTEIITPGTLIEENILQNNINNYLFALNIKGLYIETAYLDLSTGDFEINEMEYSPDLSILKGLLHNINPKEIIIPEDIWLEDKNIREIFSEYEHILVNRFPRWVFENEENIIFAREHFSGKLDDIKTKTDLSTAAVILKYVSENKKSLLTHIRDITYHKNDEVMILDESAVRNLEIIRNMRDDTSVNTLLETLDKTVTSMGARLLKKWITSPLLSVDKIKDRQKKVNAFYTDYSFLNRLGKELKNVMDMERLAGRVVMDKANPKDLVSIKLSLNASKVVFNILNEHKEFADFAEFYHNLDELALSIESAIKDEPSAFSGEGNIVRDGYNKELDEFKNISVKSKEYIAKIEEDLKAKYNVPSLRVKYNKILGYFFEVSKLQSKNMDDLFILKQSLVNTHRYTTKELSEYESKVLVAHEEINRIEEDIFNDIKKLVFDKISFILDNAKLLAEVDVYYSFAKTAFENGYLCPAVNNGNSIQIKNGRHPVVELKLESSEFIPNDLALDPGADYIHIITGPNMSGKSTFLRENALIVLMAQIGSFVPADSAEIGIVDRIFTRIGSSDNLARGQSTFLVEMLETANILKYATERSFIIMDEIGRGTSTLDGLSIAWSVLEYIYNKKALGAKTLFATHFHELTSLDKKEGIKNFSVAISEENGKIAFLHKIIPGISEKSYGIHVAGLAGLPQEVIHLAETLLLQLEKDKKNDDFGEITSNAQLELFSATDIKIKKKNEEIIEKIKYIDIEKVTPVEALNIIFDLQKKLKK